MEQGILGPRCPRCGCQPTFMWVGICAEGHRSLAVRPDGRCEVPEDYEIEETGQLLINRECSAAMRWARVLQSEFDWTTYDWDSLRTVGGSR